VLYLKHLQLKDFMSISDLDLNFDKINLISGSNGSGKSSIFEAIALCLTSKKRSTSYQDYVKQGKEFAKIILDCEINNEPVNFNIQLNLVKGNPFQIALLYKGKIYNNKETEEIIESFGLNYYSDLIFSMQTDDDITKLTPAQRAYYLQKLLNFDFDEQKISLKKSLDQFEEILKINNTEIPLKQSYIQREKDSLEELKQLVETEDDIKNIRNTLSKKEIELLEAEKNLSKLSELNNQLNSINTKLISSKELVNVNTNLVNTIEKSLKKDKESDKIIAETTETIKKLELSCKEEEEKKEKLKLEINEIDNEIKDLSNHKLILVALNVEIDRLEKLYDSDNCPYCGQKTKEAAESQYIKYISSQNIPTGLLDNIDTILGCKESIIQKLEEFNFLLEERNKEIRIKEETWSKLNGDQSNFILLSSEKNKVTSLLDEKGAYTIKDLNTTKKVLKESEDTVVAIISQKEKLQSVIKEFSQIKISDISKEIELLKNRIFVHNNTITTNEEIIKRNKRRNENIETIQKEINELTNRNIEIIKQRDVYEEAYKIFDKDLPNFMSIKACSILQENINDFIQNIFSNYEVSLQASKKGCEFFYTKNKSIQESTKKNNYLINTKMSSGFEKALLTLAFKTSLADLYNCDCLFLDESDGAADDENTQILYEHLMNMSNFNQIFLITHKNFIKEFVTNNYQSKVFEIEKGVLV
jgi:DNA repair exonuclease SbcCD ATPase subunit